MTSTNGELRAWHDLFALNVLSPVLLAEDTSEQAFEADAFDKLTIKDYELQAAKYDVPADPSDSSLCVAMYELQPVVPKY